MTILSLHKLTFLAVLALLGLSATSPVSAAPILSPRLIHAGTSDLSPGSALFPSSQSTLSSLSRRNSKLHRREETGVIQGGGNASVKLGTHTKGIFGLQVEATAKVGGGNKSKKHGENKSKKHGGNQEKKKKH